MPMATHLWVPPVSEPSRPQNTRPMQTRAKFGIVKPMEGYLLAANGYLG